MIIPRNHHHEYKLQFIKPINLICLITLIRNLIKFRRTNNTFQNETFTYEYSA